MTPILMTKFILKIIQSFRNDVSCFNIGGAGEKGHMNECFYLTMEEECEKFFRWVFQMFVNSYINYKIKRNFHPFKQSLFLINHSFNQG